MTANDGKLSSDNEHAHAGKATGGSTMLESGYSTDIAARGLSSAAMSELARRQISEAALSVMSEDEIDAELHHRHGTLFTASSHIITAIIGAGVLGLPSSLAWLGWIGGTFCIVAFYLVTLLTSTLLTKCYELKDGHKNRRYMDAVEHILGPRAKIALIVLQYFNLVLSGIAYTIAAAKSGEAVLLAAQKEADADLGGIWKEVLVFGAVQLVFSQLPDLDSAWWSSAIGAAMSIMYSAMALGICASKASNGHGTIGGIPGTSTANKVFNILNALGNVAFAYNFSTVLLEIQDTLREPPKAHKTMDKSIQISVGTSFSFYLSVAITGYLALGNDNMVGDILAAPGIAPPWVLIWANVGVFIHMISAYQVFSQPVFFSVEQLLRKHYPDSIGKMNHRTLMIIWRSLYVCFTTLISCVLPFFNSIVGLVGAMVFWPCAIFFPIMMYTTIKPVSKKAKIGLHTINVVMCLVALLAVVGSVQSIIVNASSYKIF